MLFIFFSAKDVASVDIIAIDNESTIVVGKNMSGYAIPNAIPKRERACSLV